MRGERKRGTGYTPAPLLQAEENEARITETTDVFFAREDYGTPCGFDYENCYD